MGDTKIKIYKHISFVFLGIVVIVVFFIYFITYLHKDVTSANPLIFWTVENHLTITVALVLISAFLGYISSSITYKQLNKTKKESKKLLEMLFLFLNNEEKEIINHLVKQNGLSSQAEISRLPEMNRVKAFRTLQKMQEKDLIDVTAHGKVRKINLKENISNILLKFND